MKRIIFTLSIIFLFLGCEEDLYFYHTVTNNSANETVSVKFYRAEEIINLNPGETKDVALLKGTNGQSGIEYYTPEKRVSIKYTSSMGICEFNDLKSYEIRILNLSNIAGTVTADGWTTEINFSEDSAEQSNVSWLLFKTNPVFSVTTNNGYLLPVIYTRDGDIFIITIGS